MWIYENMKLYAKEWKLNGKEAYFNFVVLTSVCQQLCLE